MSLRDLRVGPSDGLPHPNADDLWYRLFWMMQRAGLQQKELAAKLGVSTTYINDIVNGRRRGTPALLSAFCMACGASDRIHEIHHLAATEEGWLLLGP